MSNISITGSRTYPATADEWKELDDNSKLEQTRITSTLVGEFVKNLPDGTSVVSGGARGIDSLAVALAKERGLDTTEIKPDWDKYGKGAGFRRNKQIAQVADECLVFWDGESPGTKNFIKAAFKLRRPLYIIGPNGVPWAIFDEEFYEREGPNARMDIPRG